jgi:hypothetical protein
MTDTVDVKAVEVDPLETAIMTLQFTVKEINAILNMVGTLPYVQSASLITAIQNQCAPQIQALNAASQPTGDSSEPATASN